MTRAQDGIQEVAAFEYQLFPWLLGFCAYFGFGILLTTEALNRKNDLSVVFRGALFALGLWSIRLVLHRLMSPRRFRFEADLVSAENWWGTTRSWKVNGLSVKGTTLGSWWDGSIAILDDAGRRVAFRYWRDLPRHVEMTQKFST